MPGGDLPGLLAAASKDEGPVLAAETEGRSDEWIGFGADAPANGAAGLASLDVGWTPDPQASDPDGEGDDGDVVIDGPRSRTTSYEWDTGGSGGTGGSTGGTGEGGEGGGGTPNDDADGDGQPDQDIIITYTPEQKASAQAAYDRASFEINFAMIVLSSAIGAYTAWANSIAVAALGAGGWELLSQNKDSAIAGLTQLYYDADGADGIWGNGYPSPTPIMP